MTDAVVVGAGPNGLAGAITLAEHGLEVTVLEAAEEIGGGTRTAELIVPGVRHDVCSAVHPFSVLSPLLRSPDLERHGLRWCRPEIDLTHPLDGGRVGVMVSSLDTTVAGLGADGAAWRRLFRPIVRRLDDIAEDALRPVLHVPRHPIEFGRFGLRAVRPATLLARRWDEDEARALFAGVAAHTIQPLEQPLTSAIAVMLIATAHHSGWPVAEGGSRAITDAMAARLNELGGSIHTGVRVTSLDELPTSRIVLLDVAPGAAVEIIGDRMPARVRRSYTRWRHGPAAFKVDLVVEGGVPWRDESSARAGSVHCGGTLEEIAVAEREVHGGRMPARPFVLVAQQYVADPTRSKGDLHPIWAYAHAPSGFTGDATDAVIDQIERFAPGLRERIIGFRVRRPADLETDNANYVGGDLITGANDPLQILFRPRFSFDPYATGVPGVFLCSAATPPGAGAHGLCGRNAAQSALRFLTGRAAR
jgi:phytoene dehydrogenase-like protein